MNLLSRLDESPPFALYYFAKVNRKHPGLEALSEKSGLSVSAIERLARSISWKNVKVDTIDRFCKAVGENFIINKPSRGLMVGSRCYFAKPFKSYLVHLASNPKNPLRHLDPNQKRRFMMLCRKWKEARSDPF